LFLVSCLLYLITEMRYLLILLLLSSCIKSSVLNKPNLDNQLSYTVEFDGGGTVTTTNTDLQTIFHRSAQVNGEVLIIVGGTFVFGTDAYTLSFILKNITATGVWPFESSPPSEALGQIVKGNPQSPAATYTTSDYFTVTGNPPGQIVIDSITSTYIKGSFDAYFNGSGVTVHSTGTFRGVLSQ
jgi:hypothetical protein